MSILNNEAVRVGINGFGRIGRGVARIALQDSRFQLVAVNELNKDIANAVYLYNYDSTYGRPSVVASYDSTSRSIDFGETRAGFFSCQACDAVKWEDFGVDIIVEATSIAGNVAACRSLVDAGRSRKAIITHSPENGVDRYIVMGVNDNEYDFANDHIVSSSICDTNAISHVLKALDERFGIKRGFVTILHPWLSYQNLVDGPVAWQKLPGSYWQDYSLGRSSVGALIPKNTTAVKCLREILPDVEARLGGFSFRIPTQVVCTADLSITLKGVVNSEQLIEYLREYFQGSNYVRVNDDPLISIDFKGESYSAVIDARWLQVLDEKFVKIVLWYDNEYGYCSRVLDLARLMASVW